MIRVVHPGSRIRMLTFYPSRILDPGSRGQKGTSSWILILKTAFMLFDMQVNQAIEANMVRPELPEEADRVEQLMVEFRHVPHTQDDRLSDPDPSLVV
jgi:hypothetical protein